MNITQHEMLALAISNAAMAHANQFDKAGLPYILHCLKVMYLLKSDDPELMAIAVLHDIVEDTKTTYTDLYDMGMSRRVVDGVRALTKQRGQTTTDYLEQVKNNPDAIKVKLADLRHNSDIRRLKGITDDDVK